MKSLSSVKLFVCSQCTFSSNSKRKIKKHAVSHLGIVYFHCKQCYYKTKVKRQLKHHKMKYCPSKRYKCTQCTYNTAVQALLNAHRSVHSIRFPCKYCNKSFANEDHLSRHMKLHAIETDLSREERNLQHEINSNIPDTVPRQLNAEDSVAFNFKMEIEDDNDTDQQIEPTFFIKIKETTGSNSELQRQFSEICPSPKSAPLLDEALKDKSANRNESYGGKFLKSLDSSDEIQFPCLVRIRKLDLPNANENHFLGSQDLNKISLNTPQNKASSCEHDLVHSLPNHVQSNLSMRKYPINFQTKMRNNRVKLFPCTLCSYSTEKEVDFRIHLRAHAGEKLFRCELCSYCTDIRNDFKLHRRIHARKEKVYRRSLKRHMKIHTGERPFQCTLCNTSFTQKCSLTRHFSTFRHIRNLSNQKINESEVEDSKQSNPTKVEHFSKYHCSKTSPFILNTWSSTNNKLKLGRSQFNHRLKIVQKPSKQSEVVLKAVDTPNSKHETKILTKTHNEARKHLKSFDSNDKIHLRCFVRVKKLNMDRNKVVESQAMTKYDDNKIWKAGMPNVKIFEEANEAYVECIDDENFNLKSSDHNMEIKFSETFPFKLNDEDNLATNFEKEVEVAGGPRTSDRYSSSKPNHQTGNLNDCLNTKDIIFCCPLCSFSTRKETNLSKHRNTHTGQKLFSCLRCPSRFVHLRSLKRHLPIHTGGRPFHCTLCGKSFTQNHHLKRHLLTKDHVRKEVKHPCPSTDEIIKH